MFIWSEDKADYVNIDHINRFSIMRLDKDCLQVCAVLDHGMPIVIYTGVTERACIGYIEQNLETNKRLTQDNVLSDFYVNVKGVNNNGS